MIKTYYKETKEYKSLQYIADYLNFRANNAKENYHYEVEDTYFDFGQDWKWTTIIVYGKYEYQILSPAQHEAILEAETTNELDAIGHTLWYKRIR